MRRIIISLVLPLVGSCSPGPDQSDFIARVGSSYLTRDELPAQDGAVADSARQFRFVNEWVSSELFYQEALSKGFRERPEVTEKLREIERQIVINSLIEDELYQDTASITDDAVTSYFAEHEESFALREDVALLSFLHFDDRQTANTFRSGVLRGSPWTEAISNARVNPDLAPHLLLLVEKQYYTRARLYPEELWKVARGLQPERVSFVISAEGGYYVLYLHGFRRKSESPDLRYVVGDIRARLLILERQRLYEEMLQQLRRKYPVEVRLAKLASVAAE